MVEGDIREGLNLSDEESQSSTQSRAASAIQERWRRYRQRKAEEESIRLQNEDTDENVDVMLDSDEDDVMESGKSCSPSILCCGSNRVSPKPEIEESCDIDKEKNQYESKTLSKQLPKKCENVQTEKSDNLMQNALDEITEDESNKGEKAKMSTQRVLDETDQNDDESEINCEDQVEEDMNTTNIDCLEDSYADLRETGVEPTLNITYRNEGTSASSISIGECEPLPGPSRVVTGPGQVGFDPVTGARRRRSGISSVPTSAILNDNVERKESIKEEKRNIVEYETFDTDDSDEEIDINFDDLDKVGQQSNRRTINQPPILKKFTGHRNARTMIKEAAW